MNFRYKFLLGAVVLSIVGVALLYFTQPARRAYSMLNKSETLVVGKAGFAEVSDVASYLNAKASDPCTPDECSWGVLADNSALPKFWRGSGTSFGIDLRVKNGMLFEREYALMIGVGVNRPYAVVEERQHWRDIPEPVHVEPHRTYDNEKLNVAIHLTPSARDTDRRKYLQLNLWCLSKFHGCKDPQQLLPTVDWNK